MLCPSVAVPPLSVGPRGGFGFTPFKHHRSPCFCGFYKIRVGLLLEEFSGFPASVVVRRVRYYPNEDIEVSVAAVKSCISSAVVQITAGDLGVRMCCRDFRDPYLFWTFDFAGKTPRPNSEPDTSLVGLSLKRIVILTFSSIL